MKWYVTYAPCGLGYKVFATLTMFDLIMVLNHWSIMGISQDLRMRRVFIVLHILFPMQMLF